MNHFLLLLVLLLVLGCYSIGQLLKHYEFPKSYMLLLLPIVIVMAAATTMLPGCFYSTPSFLEINNLAQSQIFILHMTSSILLMSFITLIYLLVAFAYLAFKYRKQIETFNLDHTQLTQMSKEAELSILRQQLQPHFLFNSFNSLNALIDLEPSQAKEMVQLLSDYFRSNIHQSKDQNFTLESELSSLEKYLAIEKVRFGHRLNIQIETQSEHQALKVPSLLLQPLVENAIKFGLYDTIGNVTITIRTQIAPQGLSIAIENPFDIETSSNQQGTGFGLKAIRRRLELTFNRTDLLTTQIIHRCFIVKVLIPQPTTL